LRAAGLLSHCLIFTNVPPPHSTIRPGSPVPVNTNNPGVHKAARFGVYNYNNKSNDLFLFKESQIKKAMVQVRANKAERQRDVVFSCLITACNAEINQKTPELSHLFPFYSQMLRCYFEVWITPWTHKVHIPVAHCHQDLSP
uniref:Cystatin domain-containing protein n=1 Tax=Ficedula albicollis TaxID=59894 RepID=U3JCS6_FICAL